MDKQLVFLIGAGRSGTTLLYKLLALHPDVGFVSNYDRLLPHWLPSGWLVRLLKASPELKRAMWFEEGGNAYFFDKGLRRVFPAPVEGESAYAGCGLPLVPVPNYRLPTAVATRLRRRFARMQDRTGARVFVTKRTANNRRLPWLREAFPDARFIHLIRDGRDVAYSLARVKWWPSHTVFWAGCTPVELEVKGMHPLEICARNWVEETRALQCGLEGVARDRLLEIRYETLLGEPLAAIKRVTDFLQLPMPARFKAVVRSLGLARRGPAWRRDWSESDLERVSTQQYALLKDFQYV